MVSIVAIRLATFREIAFCFAMSESTFSTVNISPSLGEAAPVNIISPPFSSNISPPIGEAAHVNITGGSDREVEYLTRCSDQDIVNNSGFNSEEDVQVEVDGGEEEVQQERPPPNDEDAATLIEWRNCTWSRDWEGSIEWVERVREEGYIDALARFMQHNRFESEFVPRCLGGSMPRTKPLSKAFERFKAQSTPKREKQKRKRFSPPPPPSSDSRSDRSGSEGSEEDVNPGVSLKAGSGNVTPWKRKKFDKAWKQELLLFIETVVDEVVIVRKNSRFTYWQVPPISVDRSESVCEVLARLGLPVVLEGVLHVGPYPEGQWWLGPVWREKARWFGEPVDVQPVHGYGERYRGNYFSLYEKSADEHVELEPADLFDLPPRQAWAEVLLEAQPLPPLDNRPKVYSVRLAAMYHTEKLANNALLSSMLDRMLSDPKVDPHYACDVGIHHWSACYALQTANDVSEQRLRWLDQDQPTIEGFMARNQVIPGTKLPLRPLRGALRAGRAWITQAVQWIVQRAERWNQDKEGPPPSPNDRDRDDGGSGVSHEKSPDGAAGQEESSDGGDDVDGWEWLEKSRKASETLATDFVGDLKWFLEQELAKAQQNAEDSVMTIQNALMVLPSLICVALEQVGELSREACFELLKFPVPLPIRAAMGLVAGADADWTNLLIHQGFVGERLQWLSTWHGAQGLVSPDAIRDFAKREDVSGFGCTLETLYLEYQGQRYWPGHWMTMPCEPCISVENLWTPTPGLTSPFVLYRAGLIPFHCYSQALLREAVISRLGRKVQTASLESVSRYISTIRHGRWPAFRDDEIQETYQIEPFASLLVNMAPQRRRFHLDRLFAHLNMIYDRYVYASHDRGFVKIDEVLARPKPRTIINGDPDLFRSMVGWITAIKNVWKSRLCWQIFPGVHLAYAADWDENQRAEWRGLAASRPNEIWIAVGGDDNVTIWGDKAYEADAEACDQSHRAAILMLTRTLLEIMGVPADVIKDIDDAYHRPVIFGGFFRVVFHEPQLHTGHAWTSLLNSIVIGALCVLIALEWVNRPTATMAQLEIIAKAVAASFGMTWKVKAGDAKYVTFLKGYWVKSCPESQYGWVWCPLPSCLAKSWKVRCDGAVSKKMVVRRFNDIALSRVYQSHHPVAREYFDQATRPLKKTEERLKQAWEFYRRQHWSPADMPTEGQWSLRGHDGLDQGHRDFCLHRYGCIWTQEDVEFAGTTGRVCPGQWTRWWRTPFAQALARVDFEITDDLCPGQILP